MEDTDTGNVDGWVALVADNGNEWTFKSINIRRGDFDPSNAPDFRKQRDNGAWKCLKERVVFDDIKCSRQISSLPHFKPGARVRFWGYRSDNSAHFWEGAGSNTVLEGPKDKSPVGQNCPNKPKSKCAKKKVEENVIEDWQLWFYGILAIVFQILPIIVFVAENI